MAGWRPQPSRSGWRPRPCPSWLTWTSAPPDLLACTTIVEPAMLAIALLPAKHADHLIQYAPRLLPCALVVPCAHEAQPALHAQALLPAEHADQCTQPRAMHVPT